MKRSKHAQHGHKLCRLNSREFANHRCVMRSKEVQALQDITLEPDDRGQIVVDQQTTSRSQPAWMPKVVENKVEDNVRLREGLL